MIRTSHVGSFPLPPSFENIERIVDDLYSIGLDAPPYPQLRSFINIYLDPLKDLGVLFERDGFYFLDDPEKLSLLEDYKPHVLEAEQTIEIVRGGRYGFKWLRAPVTGVFTLASRIYLSRNIGEGLKATLLARKDLIEPMKTYVAKHLEYMSRLGYNILFIDEPVLGVIVGRRRILFGYTGEDIVETINTLFNKLSGEHGIHVCGRISPRLFKLLASVEKLDILNFEFHDSPTNLKVIDGELLVSSGKKLAPGIASSKKPVVEDIEELKQILLGTGERVDWRIDLVSADCGFGGLSVEGGDQWRAYRIGIEKLRNIVRVVKSITLD